MATRTRKTIKATIVDTPFVDQPQAATVEEETPESFAAKFNWAYLIKGEASWKRWIVAAIASLATSSAFIALAIYALSVLLVMYAGYRASMFTYIKVLDKTVDAKCASAWHWTTSLFKSAPKVTA